MTKRDIARRLSKITHYKASSIDVLSLCEYYGFKPYDVVCIDYSLTEITFFFKNYFRCKFISITRFDLFNLFMRIIYD